MADKRFMIIQGAHMNYNFMEELRERQQQGKDLGAHAALLNDMPGQRLGQLAEINPAKDGLTPARRALAKAPGQVGKLPEDFPDTIGKAFANEMMRRMGDVTGEDGQPKDSTDLRHALGSTIDWVRERFGEETAAAAAGMVLQSTSSGVTEETLGEGLLNTLKFIDRNFGIAAGDAAIAQFNNTINPALNEFFDNGADELFFAVETPADGTSATQDLNTRFFTQALQESDGEDIEEAFEELTDILDELKGELDNIAELRGLVTQLETELSPAQVDTQTALAAYEAAPEFSEPQLTSVNV